MPGTHPQAPVNPVIQIPGYKIMEMLGKGGMATVYLAIQESIGRKVALKILAPDHTDETFSDRFLREARIISELTHPHIITVYDAGVVQGYHYMSMEYVPGKNLTQARDELTRKQKVGIIKQIALALDYAGKKGYVHRDIKPENIMLHEDGHAILTDFGIARGQDLTRGLTQTGKAIGTPYFMSPEQTKGLQVDQRSDIYSLGVVLFQAVAGRVPFDGPSIVAIGIKQISEPIPILPAGMELFQPIINKCMSKEPAHRYQHASELFAALDAITEAQLDFIDAKAKAMRNSLPAHNWHTQPEQPSVEILANSVSRPVVSSKSLPQIRAQRVSGPIDITDSDDYKRLTRRRRGWFAVLIVLAVAVFGYSQQDKLLALWQNRIAPFITDSALSKPQAPQPVVTAPAQDTAGPAQAQPGEVAPAVPEPTPASDAQATTPPGEKTLEEVALDIQVYKDKLRINPEDLESRQGIEKSRQWFHDKIQSALLSKDVDAARQLFTALQRSLPRASHTPPFARVEQQIRAVEQFNTHVQKARVYLAANAVAKPQGANALEEYLAASRIDANDPAVRQGLQQIAMHFYDKARAAQAENKLADAVQYVVSGLQAAANDPALLSLQKELESGIKQEKQLGALLDEAAELMRKDQVIEPATTSAYRLYQDVAKRDPKNQAALAGLQQVQLWLLSKTQGLYDKQDYLAARNLLKTAQDYFPNSKLFSPLSVKVEQAIDATYPKITRIDFGPAPLQSLSGHSQLDKLAPGQKLYAGFAFKNFYEPATTLIARLKDSAGQMLFDEQSVTVNGTRGEGFFALQLPLPGSGDGSYSVELYMNEVRILKANLTGLH